MNLKLANALGVISLLTLTIQNALQTVVMRYVRTREGDMFLSTTAVTMSEFVKCIICILIVLIEQRFNLIAWISHLKNNVFKDFYDCLKISIPAFLYVIQNNLLYLAVSNLDAHIFQIAYQLKLLTTAVFSTLVLGKSFSKLQWFSLLCLFCGISYVQMESMDSPKKVSTNSSQNEMLGLIAVIVACILSGFSGVYFEKILKSTPQSVYVRNIQLGSLGFVFSLLTCYVRDGHMIETNGFFYGYNYGVWFTILLLATGGLIVAVVIKYTDNIMKGFATSGSIIIACISSIFIFDFQLTIGFTLGASFVICSILLYTISSENVEIKSAATIKTTV